MYQAITTKYIGPTNVRGSRVKAICAAGSLTLGWDNRWNSEQNHTYAAMQLAKKLDWSSFKFHGGCDHNGDYVFVSETETYFTMDYEPHGRSNRYDNADTCGDCGVGAGEHADDCIRLHLDNS